MKKHFLLLALPLMVAVACDAKPTESKSAGETKPTASTTGSSPAPAPTEQAAPAADLSKLPESLKTDAFHYYGLGNTKPMNMEVVDSNMPTNAYTGTQSITLKSIEGNKAIFALDRTGQLALLGSQELRLEPDGLYNHSSTLAKIGPKDVELPSKLTPGTTWKSHTELDQEGQKIVNDSTFKVVGTQKVKTKGGEHDALLITSTGPSTIRGQKATTTSKNWYVKDLGQVKSVLTIAYAGGKTQTITIQETK